MQNAKQTAVRRTTHPATAAAARAAARAARFTAAQLAAMTAKRSLDLVLGSVLLALVSPALALGAVTLALRAGRRPGGVLRRDIRAGLGGRPFELRSLRTRRFRLDLLSRLPHVVRGELSLVGPAPLAPGDPAAGGPGCHHWRQELRPGLTGLAQVRAGSGMPWDEPALLDAYYAEHHGTGLDLAILAHTARIQLRTALHGLARRRKARLSDTNHRLPRYSTAE
ncbi:sugar transferase [Streptomyces sp. NPDC005566]|uniref:sugar transferase n=1 Tax=Streptomyces sp. NPDC005566 TaxID=3156886 RepID=UPI0033BE0512